MTNPGGGALRVARGGVLAVLCTLVAIAGHARGGGEAPPIPALLAVAALVGTAFVVLADRRRGFTEILFAALACQPAFHLAFSIPVHEAGAVAPIDAPMVGGHVLAGVVTATLLTYGEDALWAVYHLLTGVRAPVLEPVPVLAPPAPARPDGAELAPVRRQLLARIPPRRGPPVRDSLEARTETHTSTIGRARNRCCPESLASSAA